jgi:UDP-glucose 4-epimerase
MKILVTGSEGSLMQAVIPKLVAQGHTVMGVDNLSRYGKRAGRAEGYEFVQTDLIDANICHTLTYGHDVVIHAAALIFGVGGFHERCADILGKDVTLVTNMLRASCDHNIKRFVYISSSMVFERCDSSEEYLINSPEVYKIPVTDYGLSKYMGERLCRAYYKQYGLEFTIWRPFNIITPHEKAGHEIGESHVFADYITNIIQKKLNPLPIIGSGEQVRSFTWIDDVADAIAKNSFSDTTKNEDYNLGRKEPVTMVELAKRIHAIGVRKGLIPDGKLSFETVKEYSDDVRKRVPSVSKAEMFLGWKAKTSLNESLEECIK